MTEDLIPPPNLTDLAAATPEEIAEALLYALRYDERGKPRRGGWDFAAGLAAERLTDHLRRSGFVVMRARQCQARRGTRGRPAAVVEVNVTERGHTSMMSSGYT
jgi:hypothetical protein